jgi:hypothetical protein
LNDLELRLTVNAKRNNYWKHTTPWTSKIVVLESMCLLAAIVQAGNFIAKDFSNSCTWYFTYLSIVVTCIVCSDQLYQAFQYIQAFPPYLHHDGHVDNTSQLHSTLWTQNPDEKIKYLGKATTHFRVCSNRGLCRRIL